MLAIIIHNIHSAVKLMDAVNIYLEFDDADILVISKATSAAAQTGVPEAEKRAYMRGRRVLYIPDLPDAVETLLLDKLYLVVPNKLAKYRFNPSELRREVENDRVGIAFSGGETAFSRRELELGAPVTLGFEGIIPPSAAIGIVLYSLFPKV